jgi:2-methylcitrate dehydratase PrpD
MATDARSDTAKRMGRLLEWATAVTPATLPPAILARAALVLVDDLAAMVAASGEEEIGRARAALAKTTAGKEATVLAAGAPRLDRYSAAACNGLAAVWAELDEGYRIAPCHAGAYSVAAGIAEAEATGATVANLLTAIAVSYEISARLARAFPFETFSVHPHGAFAPLGAAAVTAHLRGLAGDDFAGAVTGAASMAYAGPYSHAIEGTLVRNAWTATGAWTGMRAVDLAVAGIGGALTTPYDVFAVCFKSSVAGIELDRDLGSDWAIAGGYHKVFACCQYAHSAVEANLDIFKRLPAGFGPDDIREIVVETHPKGQTLTTVEPETVLAAKFSLPHILAATAVLGTGSARAFFGPTLTEPRISALRHRVRLAAYEPIDPWPNDRPARVTWRLTDGTELSGQSVNARGGADQPFTAEELLAKGAELTGASFPEFARIARSLVTDPQAMGERLWSDVVKDMTRVASS